MATNLLAPKSVNMLQRSGEGPELRQQYPKFYGLLGGLLGTAPDEFEGSAMDPLTVQVRQGAEFGYPVGTAAAVIPFGGGVAAGKGVVQGGKVAQKGIVKLPGGQFLKGSGPEVFTESAYFTSGMAPEVKEWLNTVGKNYIRNQMGTVDDPLRVLANKGIVADEAAIALTRKPRISESAKYSQNEAIKIGVPGVGRATDIKTPQAAWWDNAADESIFPVSAASHQYTGPHRGQENFVGPGIKQEMRDNPWLARVSPNTPIHQVIPAYSTGFLSTFKNIGSQLESDIKAGLIRPEQLSKVSVPDAVTRTHQGLVKKIAAQNDVEKTALVYKEYPTGDKWVELGPLSGAPKNAESDFRLKKLLGNEGKRMQNCVGDYCDKVGKGAAKIYSLRDARGEPHVTIEVDPLGDRAGFIAANRGAISDIFHTQGREAEEAFIAANVKPVITQIKGKGNSTKIKPEYQSLVDDFIGDPVRWGRITR